MSPTVLGSKRWKYYRSLLSTGAMSGVRLRLTISACTTTVSSFLGSGAAATAVMGVAGVAGSAGSAGAASAAGAPDASSRACASPLALKTGFLRAGSGQRAPPIVLVAPGRGLNVSALFPFHRSFHPLVRAPRNPQLPQTTFI